MIGTKIEWADDAVNPWWGCAKVSPACQFCYAEALNNRFGHADWTPKGHRWIRVHRAQLEIDGIARKALKEGRQRRVFIASMADIFEQRGDLDDTRHRFFGHLEYHAKNSRLPDGRRAVVPMLLTKRAEAMADWAERHGWPTGAWAGVTVEDQARADERIPHLLRVPAPGRFLSCEPLLGPVYLDYSCFNGADSLGTMPGIHWIIAGGESGRHARPTHPEWFRSLREQAKRAGVPFFFKQWGEWAPPDDIAAHGRVPPGWVEEAELHRHTWPDAPVRATYAKLKKPAPAGEIGGDTEVFRAGKRDTGRLLDGVEHSEVPCVP